MLHTLMCLFGFICILLLFLLARFKYPILYNAINPLWTLNVCIFNYLYMPFNPDKPREFVFFAVILLFRTMTACTVFQMNGMYDLISTMAMTLAVIIARSFAMDKINSVGYTVFPLLMAVFGLCVLMFVIAVEQRNLFLLEKNSKKQ